MKLRHPVWILLAIAMLVGAIWTYLWLALPSPSTLDQRVNDVAVQLKCPVCQSETVADSSASIAEQMRLVIRQKLQNGQSEQQILQYFAARYGNQILLTPPKQGIYLLAWLVPGAMLLAGLGLIGLIAYDWRTVGRQAQQQQPSPVDHEALDDPELRPYRRQLEQELAHDDPWFRCADHLPIETRSCNPSHSL